MHAAHMRNVTVAEAAQESKELREEVEALNEKLRAAEKHWLPMWSHPHYDSYIAPVDRLYREVRYTTHRRKALRALRDSGCYVRLQLKKCSAMATVGARPWRLAMAAVLGYVSASHSVGSWRSGCALGWPCHYYCSR